MILQTGALAGTLAFPSRLFAAPLPRIADAAPALGSGSLVAWVRVTLDAGAKIRLVQLDEAALPVAAAPVLRLSRAALGEAPAASGWEQMRIACRAAHNLAVATAARCWGAAAADCAVEHGRILHRRLGRAVGYAVWAEFSGTT